MNDNKIMQVSEQYNCMDLDHTIIGIHSIVNQPKKSKFHYEISGKDNEHKTILFRYKYHSEDIDSKSLSASQHSVHKSVDFTEYEENGKEYTYKWEYNSPKILCWKNEELQAIKIDLFYDETVSFAFDYIYNEDILLKQGQRNSNRYSLTAKNNWNIKGGGLSYLEYGYVYFGYHHNITLYNPLTYDPTTDPTQPPTLQNKDTIIINPEQTTTNDSPSGPGENEDNNPPLIADEDGERETTKDSEGKFGEGQVVETTGLDEEDNNNERELDELGKPKEVIGDTMERPIKLLIFGIALAVLCSVCCIVWCIVWSKRKQKKHMEGIYDPASEMDSDDDEYGRKGAGYLSKGHLGDIEEEPMHNNNHNVFISEDGDIEDQQIGSGILDDDDLSDANSDDHDHNKRKNSVPSHSFKPYKKVNPNVVLPRIDGQNGHHHKVEESVSDSGIGHIASRHRLPTNEETQTEDEESLMMHDRDISMDESYNHIIQEQAEISVIENDELLDRRINDDKQQQRRHSISESDSKQFQTMLVHHSKQSMNQSMSLNLSKFNTLHNKQHINALQEEREQSVSQSEMSKLSEPSLVIPPIILDDEVMNKSVVKTNNKNNAKNVANSMKMFSQKIAKFDEGMTGMEQKEMSPMDNDDDDNDEYATMVVHKNKKKKSSAIPDSQIVVSDVPPPTTMIIPVNKYLTAKSTDTMIIKSMDDMKKAKSGPTLESQLAHIHQSSEGGMLSEDSEESSDEDEQSGKDPIDASEEEEIVNEKRRHQKNLSTISDKSHHDRRTMLINDDLDIQSLITEVEEDADF